MEFQFNWSWNYKGRTGKEVFFHTAIGDFQAGLKDWAPAFRGMVEEVLEPTVMEQFATSGHGEWAELAPSTIRYKGHARILSDTGRLESSFQRGGGEHVEEIGRTTLVWGSRVPYGIFHQTGTGSGFGRRQKGPGRGMPQRKILELSETAKRRMRSLIVQHVATLARRIGFAVTGV
jgi:phage gpG-like protein